MAEDKITINLNGKLTDCPVLVGTENEYAIDIDKLRADTGFVTLDFGYKNTGATTSKITFLDGEEGILRYRGYDIADLAENSNFTEVMYLLLYGELPTAAQLADFNQKLKDNSDVPAEAAAILKSMPKGAHPMAQLSALTVVMSGVYKDGAKLTEENFINILAKFPVLVAMVIRNSQGLDFVPNDKNLDYVSNFLQMSFGKPASSVLVDAMNKLLILHADHEQNCSTSTVRMVGSSNANIYASISGGINALWGPLHGGANQAVLEQLEAIENDGGDTAKFVAMAKDKNSGFRLMGFGHRVYKNFDPRAKIIKKSCDEVLSDLGVTDKKLTIAMELEQAALHDDYFVSRKLYPNVDFYSGIIYQALGFPTDSFTTLFALGRLPGWVSQWKELKENKEPIGRPRQIYMGSTLRSYTSILER
ncbi:MAG: hypothetical protein RJA25_1356 [Bacteroidota bacterium]|jgi:citrate synthase